MSNQEPSPETPKTRRRPLKGLPPAAFAVLGIGIGVAGTLSIIGPARHGAAVPAPASQKPASETEPAVTSPMAPLKPVASNAPPEKITATDKKPANLPDLPIDPSITAPVNPFGETKDLISKLPPLPTAPPALKGALPKTPMVPPEYIASNKTPKGSEPGSAYLDDILEKGIPKPPAALHAGEATTPKAPAENPPAPAKGACDLLTVREVAVNPDSQSDEIAAFAKTLKGSAEILVERAPAVSQKDRKPVVTGLLVTLPPDTVDAFQKHLKENSAFVDAETWNGSADARRGRLTREAQARVASLGSLRQALLVTYMEDAEAVKDVDEDIARAKKVLQQLQTDASTDNQTVVRIVFISK